MKTKTVATLPKCDFCGKDAVYDAPTIHGGSWANMCADCYTDHGRDNPAILGTKFEKRGPKPDNSKTEVKEAICNSTEEEMVFDSIIDLECPSCGESRSMEPDFSGEYTCEGCGQKLKFSNPLY